MYICICVCIYVYICIYICIYIYIQVDKALHELGIFERKERANAPADLRVQASAVRQRQLAAAAATRGRTSRVGPDGSWKVLGLLVLLVQKYKC